MAITVEMLSFRMWRWWLPVPPKRLHNLLGGIAFQKLLVFICQTSSMYSMVIFLGFWLIVYGWKGQLLNGVCPCWPFFDPLQAVSLSWCQCTLLVISTVWHHVVYGWILTLLGRIQSLSSETLKITYQSIRCHNPEDHFREVLPSRIILTLRL
jgi:hypothetical protein